jgi:L-amino acid N-acyltransferase YncA
MIAAMSPEEWPAVRAIYEEGIATGDATFETEVPSWAAWDAAHLGEHRLVARRGEPPAALDHGHQDPAARIWRRSSHW